MRTRAWLRHLAMAGLAAALLVAAVPVVAGVSWTGTWSSLAAVPAAALALLAGVWLLGLGAHSFVLTAALPGLGHRRALMLSLTGSSVANVLPLGGAAGIALNYSMARGWGHDRVAFTAYTVVTNIWDVLSKLAIPAVALAVLTAAPAVRGAASLQLVGVVSTVVLAVAAGLLAWVATRSERVRRAGELRAACLAVVRSSWRRLTAGMAAYQLCLGVLLGLCLHVAGVGLPVTAVVVALAVDRVATLANLTPGGLGVVELGLVGVLVAMGGQPTSVLAGVLLYRAFTFALEIPVGGVWLAGWWLARVRRDRRLQWAGASR